MPQEPSIPVPKVITPGKSPKSGSEVTSTAYCLTGHMADGTPAEQGAVASNAHPLGTVLEASDSPWGPGTFVVRDRIGWGSQLDFAIPGDCALARRWGRRRVSVAVR
jgi:3D (Asp-Asp-Asp) domain-containing protein